MIDFFVAGLPVAKGNMRAFLPKGWTRPVVTEGRGSKTRGWQDAIHTAAQMAMGDAVPVDRPLGVVLVFTMPRPKAHLRADGSVRPGRPAHPTAKPDIDKLARAALDGLTGVVFIDDSRVASLCATKVYGERPGVRVRVDELERGEAEPAGMQP